MHKLLNQLPRKSMGRWHVRGPWQKPLDFGVILDDIDVMIMLKVTGVVRLG